jgi:hypothetical protein
VVHRLVLGLALASPPAPDDATTGPPVDPPVATEADADTAPTGSTAPSPPPSPIDAAPIAEPTPPIAERDEPPTSASPAAPSPTPNTTEPVRRVTVLSTAETMERTAEAVEVVDTAGAQRQTADLGQVLARTRGVTLRRAGGLGTTSNLGLGGLDGAQVPFFVDGVPLEFSPFSLDPANIPVGLVDRVEIYRGVVPIRFGADTLGGAVNLARGGPGFGPRRAPAVQARWFDTHRALAQSSTLLEGPGLYAAAFGFLDHSRNDYAIDVEVAQDDGSLVPATVQRRHDRYLAGGGGITLGFVDRRWADRLLVTAFASALAKEIPHNVVMTVPYGGATYGEIRPGANLRYEKSFAHDLELSVTSAYAQRRIRFTDTDHCVYDWYGRCVLEKASAGEITTLGTDQRITQDGGYGNVGLTWSPGRHALRVVLAPSGFTRRGTNRLADPDVRDPLTARRVLFNFVSGVEYQIDALDDRLQNVAFVKDYVQTVIADRVVPGADAYPTIRRADHEVGAGDALRYRFAPWGYAKASYEWATRLPGVDEIFGDGVLVVSNLELEPERSHNLNLGATLDGRTRAGRLWFDVLGSARFVADAIAPIPEDNRISSQNVNDARSLAADAAAGWTSPGDWVTLDGNVTFVDYRNTSGDGPFGPYDGDRMPARPWLLANGHARLQIGDLAGRDDTLALDWTTRYVHGFFRGWESAGTTAFKQRVPMQLLHGIGASYVVARARWEVATALELHNVLDARAYDFIGVQLPRRSVQARISVSF